MTENKQNNNDRTDRRPDCVTEIRMGNTVLVVSGFFKKDTTATAADKMVNMQLTNQKLVDRGTRMLVDILGLDYGKAKSLLLLHGSVEKVLQETKLPTKDE